MFGCALSFDFSKGAGARLDRKIYYRPLICNAGNVKLGLISLRFSQS